MELKIGDCVRVKKRISIAGKIIRRNLIDSRYWAVESFNINDEWKTSWLPEDLEIISDEETMLYILENS